jgi:hypothetical protein
LLMRRRPLTVQHVEAPRVVRAAFTERVEVWRTSTSTTSKPATCTLEFT